MNSDVILNFMKKVRHYNFSIFKDIYQNRLVNLCARKKLAKISQEVKDRTFLMIVYYR